MRNVISRVKGSQPAPILLVANKLDLDCQREVSTAEGKLFRRSCVSVPSILASVYSTGHSCAFRQVSNQKKP